MRFLIDAQLPPAFAGWLRDRGHEAEHVAQIDMLAATDAAIAAYAEANDAVLATKDEDFVALRLPDRFVLLWLRCGNATNRALLAWLEPRWDEIERLLSEGERFIEVR
jgi:predicted nuclease of predicted toxin-antitoxin system